MKMVLTPAKIPSEYVEFLGGWQRLYVDALRQAVLAAAPELEERIKWGHLVYFAQGPVLLIRAEPARVLLGFWHGKRLRHIESRLGGAGKYEMGTLELHQGTSLEREVVTRLVAEAVGLNRTLGDPTSAAPSSP